MKKRICKTLVLITLLLAMASYAKQYDRKANEQAIQKEIQKMDEGVAQGPFKAEWDSLKAHNEAPEWFRDAKLGIYFHWGVYSVPAFGSEWYPRNMYMKGNKVYKHHVKTWGDPAEFPYTKFVPMFKAEKFNPKKSIHLANNKIKTKNFLAER
jgi:hypothetical protein